MPPSLLLALLVSSAPVGEQTSVLIVDLHTESVDGKIALQITSAIAEALSARPEYAVLTMMDVKDLLTHEDAKQIAGCEDAAACYADIEKLRDVDLLIAGTAGKVGKDLTVTLALIDGKTALDRNRVSRIVESVADLSTTMQALVRDLFGWDGTNEKRRFALPSGSKKSFAVFDLEPSGVSQEVAINLTQILSAEIKQVEGTSVIGREDLKAMLTLEADKQRLGCADDNSCLAEIGAALGVDYIVAGHIGKIAGTRIVSLRLIAPESLRVENRVNESFVGVEEQLVGAVRHAGRRLLGLGAPAQGALALSTNEGEGSVYVDGREVAGSVLADLSPGRHNLRIVKEDYLEWRSDVYVHPGLETPLSIDLESRPTEWYESWIFWTSVLGVAAIAAGTGAFVALSGEGSIGGPANPNQDQTYPFGLEVGLPDR